MHWLSQYFSKEPDAVVAENSSSCGSACDTDDERRTKELDHIVARNDRRFVVFKNTMVSYMFRKRFLKLIRALVLLQRAVRRKRFLRARQRYCARVRGADILSETYRQQTLRASLKYRAELLAEVARMDRVIKCPC
jgi:hypothetical protein